jgi:hypothetical protein
VRTHTFWREGGREGEVRVSERERESCVLRRNNNQEAVILTRIPPCILPEGFRVWGSGFRVIPSCVLSYARSRVSPFTLSSRCGVGVEG